MNLTDYDHPAIRELDHDVIAATAEAFASLLYVKGSAHIVLEPDDGTRYELMAVRRWLIVGGAPYMFASNHGSAYPWNGKASIHPDYATEKWVANGNTWTGVVYALFLNAVAERMTQLDLDVAAHGVGG